MKLLSSTDLAIAVALRAGDLRVEERVGRFGPFWSIEDAVGVIEVANTAAEAEARIAAIAAAIS